MKLGAAVQLLNGPPWACACVGGARCCFVQERKAVELQRAATIAAGLFAALLDTKTPGVTSAGGSLMRYQAREPYQIVEGGEC